MRHIRPHHITLVLGILLVGLIGTFLLVGVLVLKGVIHIPNVGKGPQNTLVRSEVTARLKDFTIVSYKESTSTIVIVDQCRLKVVVCLPGAGQTVTITAVATVSAGSNLNYAHVDVTQKDGKQVVTVSIPPTSPTGATVDKTNTNTRCGLGKCSDQLLDGASNQIQTEAIHQAVNDGISERADANAVNQLRDFLAQTLGPDVVINVVVDRSLGPTPTPAGSSIPTATPSK